MDDLVRIPCVIMRGGTSRGPYFLASDLPSDPDERDRILISVMGSGHELEIDGIGGGNPLTSKVAIVSKSSQPGADVDYLFAQVKVSERAVDTSPNCGNMLAGVGPFAIETGLIPARNGITPVRIYNVNTKKLIEARIATPNCQVVYDGEARIDGVPGTAAPVHLAFLGAAGSKTGKLLPTSSAVEQIEGIMVSCVDAAMPVVIARAEDFGKDGHESAAALSADIAFMARLEKVRIQAGIRMGFPDAAVPCDPEANHHYKRCSGRPAISCHINAMAHSLSPDRSHWQPPWSPPILWPQTSSAASISRPMFQSNILLARWTFVWNRTPNIRNPRPLSYEPRVGYLRDMSS